MNAPAPGSLLPGTSLPGVAALALVAPAMRTPRAAITATARFSGSLPTLTLIGREENQKAKVDVKGGCDEWPMASVAARP
jgi:hypothetical protein